MGSIVYREESYELLGVLFEVHNQLGGGFLEVVYPDAIEYELQLRDIKFECEKKYHVNYKDTILPHYFFADFVC